MLFITGAIAAIVALGGMMNDKEEMNGAPSILTIKAQLQSQLQVDPIPTAKVKALKRARETSRLIAFFCRRSRAFQLLI